MIEYDFEVGLSYASEQRYYVRPIAEQLRDRGVKVFYDEFYSKEIWGKNINDLFFEIFKHKLKFCVMFISSDYKHKINTNWEYNAAVDKQKNQFFSEYILPISFNGETIDTLTNLGYLKSEDFSPSQITEYLIDKLHEENFSNPIVNSAEDFLEMLQARMQNKDFIKINKKSNIELELEANFDSEKFLKIVFKIGGFYFDKNKISVYENFPGCIAPSGVLSAELEILKTTYFKIDNYCLFENKYKEPTLTMSVPEFTNALATRFEGIKNL